MKFQFLPENFSRSENAPPFETRKICQFEVERIFLENKKMVQHFWCRGYYVNTVGADTRAITAYIQNQLAEDQAMEQLTFKEYIDPFTGSKNEQAQK